MEAGPVRGIVIVAELVNDLIRPRSWFTVRRKVVVVAACPSLTPIVIVAVPNWLETGVTVTVRLAPLPPKTILLRGTRPGLDELFVNTRLASAVSTSPIVKLNGPVDVSTLIV